VAFFTSFLGLVWKLYIINDSYSIMAITPSRFRNSKTVPSPLMGERDRVRVNNSPLRLPLPLAPSRKGRGI